MRDIGPAFPSTVSWFPRINVYVFVMARSFNSVPFGFGFATGINLKRIERRRVDMTRALASWAPDIRTVKAHRCRLAASKSFVATQIPHR